MSEHRNPVWFDDNKSVSNLVIIGFGFVSSMFFLASFFSYRRNNLYLTLFSILGTINLIMPWIVMQTSKGKTFRVYEEGIEIKGQFLSWDQIAAIQTSENIMDPEKEIRTPTVLKAQGYKLNAPFVIKIIGPDNREYKFTLKNKYSFLDAMEKIDKSTLIVKGEFTPEVIR